MEISKKFGELYRQWEKDATPPGICEVCGGELEIEAESSEEHCPACENPEE